MIRKSHVPSVGSPSCYICTSPNHASQFWLLAFLRQKPQLPKMKKKEVHRRNDKMGHLHLMRVTWVQEGAHSWASSYGEIWALEANRGERVRTCTLSGSYWSLGQQHLPTPSLHSPFLPAIVYQGTCKALPWASTWLPFTTGSALTQKGIKLSFSLPPAFPSNFQKLRRKHVKSLH